MAGRAPARGTAALYFMELVGHDRTCPRTRHRQPTSISTTTSTWPVPAHGHRRRAPHALSHTDTGKRAATTTQRG